MSWQNYNLKLKGRPVRKLYTGAIELFQDQLGSAIDLGCGSGAETVDLLSRGWQVTAIDKEPSSLEAIQSLMNPEFEPKLTFVGKAFEDIESLSEADFIFASLSLPFCQSILEQDRIWSLIRKSLRPGGVFAGSFFGLKDDWVKSGNCVGVTEEKLSDYFEGFEVLHRKDMDKVGPTVHDGPKHWNTFEIIARKTNIGAMNDSCGFDSL